MRRSSRTASTAPAAMWVALCVLAAGPGCKGDEPPDPAWLSRPGQARPPPGLDRVSAPAASRSVAHDPLEHRVPVLPKLRSTAWTAEQVKEAVAEGSRVIFKHQCRRCHQIFNEPKPEVRPAAGAPPKEQNRWKRRVRYLMCVECHVFHKEELPAKTALEASLFARYPNLRKWRERIDHLLRVPSLDRLGELVEPAFLSAFLAAPTDLRPLLEESMFRTNLEAGEIVKLVRYFAAKSGRPDPYGPVPAQVRPKVVPADRLAMGKQLFVKRCAGCHQMGADSERNGPLMEVRKRFLHRTLLAPNLRFARVKIRPQTLARWIVNPRSMDRRSAMVAPGVTLQQAEVVKDYLLWTVDGTPDQGLPAAPEVRPLARKVTWAEINHDSIGHICVHCHMDDNELDAGPGNEGGFGFAPIRLSFRTYPSIMRGSIGPDGQRRSVMLPRPGQRVPILVERMLLRRQENLRDLVAPGADARRPPFASELRGMPLGLPALSDRKIAEVWTWIRQNCPAPKDGVGLDGMATFRQVLALARPGAPFFDPVIRPVTADQWRQRGCGLPPRASKVK